MQSSDIIQPLAMQSAFAIDGDKSIPNYNATGTETSSLKLGFLPITSKALDLNGQAPEREDFNGMFYLSTDLRVFLQEGGFITYRDDVASAIGGYPKGAILGFKNASGFGFVESLKENNQNTNFNTNPAFIDGTNWKYVHLLNIDTDIATVNSTITTLQNNLQGQIDTNKTNINTLNTTTVKLTGNQTISGTKTFSSSPYVPNSTSAGTALSLKNRTSNCIQFGDGTLLQWGSSSTNNHYKTITFSPVFSSTPVILITDTGSQESISNFKITGKAGSFFSVYSSSSGSSDGFDWYAIGRGL